MWPTIISNFFTAGIPAIIEAIAEARRERREQAARLKAIKKAAKADDKRKLLEECNRLVEHQQKRIARLRAKKVWREIDDNPY